MSRFALRRVPRRRGALSGFLLVVLGLWGALVPFVGPYFDYQIGTASTWDWSADRLWLSVLPGVVAVLGGLMMLSSVRRVSASFGGLLGLAAGLWFIAGPTVSVLWNGGVMATGPAFGDDGTRVLEWLGFFYGTGALITMLSSYGLGFFAALPITDEATRADVAAPAASEPVTTKDRAPSAEGRRRSRFRPRHPFARRS